MNNNKITVNNTTITDTPTLRQPHVNSLAASATLPAHFGQNSIVFQLFFSTEGAKLQEKKQF